MAACEDLGPIGGTTVPTADLVVLPLAGGAPAASAATFWVSNRTPVVRSLRHPDAFNTLYLELRFPAGCLSSLNGQPLTVNDSVLVTVAPRAGGYGFTLSPSGLVFTLASTPSVTLSYGRYADPSVADGVPTYPDRASYLAALEIWEEATVDRWRVARGSSATGVDELGAAVDAPGAFLVAARR
ncbi:MAG: hypothetical protein OER21_03490 [Gemmatimonadota bacterium]|nr:hypothetical protein [Gemmatimonadota bacterium]